MSCRLPCMRRMRIRMRCRASVRCCRWVEFKCRRFNVQDADPDALSRIGEVLLVAGGGVEVLWADGRRSTAQPAQLFVVSGDDDMGGPVR